jgi:hypothetical protein
MRNALGDAKQRLASKIDSYSRKRARNLAERLVPVTTPEGDRHMIYPAQDERVLRVVRKTVRGSAITPFVIARA